jgi:mannosyltransferase OCH1-like enzyme
MNKEISPESQTWIDMNPEYTYTIYDDADADEFVKTNFSPDIYEVYSNMPKVILKADFFRYLVLYAKGGTYADVDTRCLKKIDDWTDGKKNIRMIVGIEADVQDRKDWCEWFARRVQLVQWSMSSVAYHPAMKAVVDRIMRHSTSFMRRLEIAKAKGEHLNIMDWTGPGVWTDAIFEYIDLTYNITWEELQSLEHGMQIDDIYVLPITGFSPGVGHMGSKPVEDPEAKVQHLFHGVWKNDTHSRRSRHWHRRSFI